MRIDITEYKEVVSVNICQIYARTADETRVLRAGGTGARGRIWIAALIGLFATLLPPAGGTAHAAMNFADAVGHWADDEIRTGGEYGYIGGYPDGLFYPDNAITRAEFVKAVNAVNAAMGFTELGNIGFEDVLPDDWYYDEVRKAASAGYIAGYGNGLWFGPDRPITREEVAAALYRLDEDKTLADPGYRDMREIEWSLDAVRHAYKMGYMTGFPDDYFYPTRNLTRAETATIVNKFTGIDRAHRMITELSALYATDLTAYFSVRSHTAGTLRWEVIPASYPAPDAKQISEGKMANGQPAPLKGNLKIAANDETKFNVFLPNDNTYYANIPEYNGAYKLYAVVSGQKKMLSVVASINFSTGDAGDWAEDWLAPLNVRAVTDTTAVLDFTSSESGTLYYVVMPRTRGVPTQANIYGGQGWNADPADSSGNGPIVRDVAGAVGLKNLKPGTDYTVYAFVLKDTGDPAGRYPNWRDTSAQPLPGGNIVNVPLPDPQTLGPGILSKVASFAFRTQGRSAPALASVTGRFDTAGNLEIDVAASGAVTVYYHVLPEDRAGVTPTPEQVKALGIAAANVNTQRDGSASIAPDGGTLAPIANILSPGVTYRVYVTVEGAGGGGADSPPELSPVVFGNLVEKPQAVAPALANLTIEPIGWGTPIFGLGAGSTPFAPSNHNYTGPNGEGERVPNTYKQIRVTPLLPTTAPATASVRVNGTVLPAVGYIDLSMPAVAGTLFQVKVDVNVPGAQTVGYTVLLKENVPAVTKLYVADAQDPNPLPDGNGNYEVRLQPSEGRRDVAVRIDIEPEMKAVFIVNGNSIGPVLPPNAFNGWQFTIPLNASAPTDVTIQVVGPTPAQEQRTYNLRIYY
jgi:hypothetical protein